MTDSELNEAVAKKLGKNFCLENDKPPHLMRDDGVCLIIPDYCHSIAAAWEIVEWCKKEMQGSWHWDFKLECSDRTWRCGIFDIEDVEADTAPMAITQAFLKLP